MSKKIDINPILFNFENSKTKKNREKKQKPNLSKINLISPNILKNKLLNRIKEHKKKDTENLDSNKTKIENSTEMNASNDNFNLDIGKYTDEFNESIDYLQNLTLQKKINEEKKMNDRIKEQKKYELERKTLKNHSSYYNEQNLSSVPLVNLDLPDTLLEGFNPMPMQINTPPLILNNKSDNVPYGVLKGGTKPTYREWQRTQKNNIVDNPKLALIPSNNNLNSIHFKGVQNDRELRLNRLKEKIRMKQLQKAEAAKSLIPKPEIKISDSNNTLPNQIQINDNNIINLNDTLEDSLTNENLIIKNRTQNNLDLNDVSINNSENLNTNINDNFNQNNIDDKPIKKITKKTIKRKYTLGKSKIQNQVSILIKNKQTRKNIIDAQKNLKKKSIPDIKKYLRDHNIIKIGSNAPNDVIRKMFESAMLAGEITNTNKDILLHNLLKDDDNN